MDTTINVSKIAEVLITTRPTEGVEQANRCLAGVLELEASGSAGTYNQLRVECLRIRARAESAIRQHARALRTLDECESLNKAAMAAADPDLGAVETDISLHVDRGIVLTAVRRWDHASAELRQALEMTERILKKYPADLYFVRDLATTSAALSRLHQAKAQARLRPADNRAAARQFATRAASVWGQWEKLAVPSAYTAHRKREAAELVAEVSMRDPR
jgi:hypothetical protein